MFKQWNITSDSQFTFGVEIKIIFRAYDLQGLPRTEVYQDN